MKRTALVGVKVADQPGPPGLPLLHHRPRARSRTASARPTSSTCWARSLCFVLMLALATWRWQILLGALGAPAPIRHLTASYLVATFFNNFLPSNIGGDIVRVRDSSQPDRLDRHVAGRRRHRPDPGFRRALPPRRGRLRPGAAHRARPRRGAGGAPRPRASSSASSPTSSSGPAPPAGSCPSRASSSIDWAREQFEVVQGAVHAYRARIRTIWIAGAASVVLQTLVVLYYLAVARGLGIPLPASAAFLMVPLCTLLQAVPVSFNGWGLREGLFTVYFAQVGLSRRERARLLARRRGPHGPPLALGRVRLDGPGQRVLRGRPRPPEPEMASPSCTSATSSASAGSSIHGVSRLFSWWFPRYDPARFEVSPVRPQAPRARHASGSASRASPSTTSAAAASTRASCRDLVALARERGARILHVHGYAAADFGRLAARAVGAKLVLHEHFADPRMPAYQALADRLLRRRTDGAIAVSRSTREFLVKERFVPAERVRLIWNGAPARRVRPRRPASAPGGSATSSGFADDALVVGYDRPSQRPEGPPLPGRRGGDGLLPQPATRPRARSSGDGDLMAASARAGRGPRHRRPRRLRRAPHRRARPPRRPRRLLHLVALRGHAARALRGHGVRQGHRLDLGRRLPRGARGRRHGRPGAARPTRRPSPRGLDRVLGDAALRDGLGRQALAASRRYDVRACVDQMQAFYDELLSGGRRLRPCPCAGSAAARARRGRCPATCCAGATRPSSPAARCPAGDVPVFVFHGAEPDSFSRKLAAPRRERLRHALGRRVRRGPARPSAGRRSARSC